MAPSACPHQRLILESFVLNKCRQPDIIRSSQPQLAADTKAPTVCLAFLSHRDTMVGPRCCVNCIDTRYLNCILEYPWFVELIADDIILREAVNADADSVRVNTTPSQACATVRHSNAVVVSPTNACDFAMTTQTIDGLRTQYVGKVLSVTFINASLAVVVGSPAVYGTILMDGKRMVGTSANVNDVFSQAEGCGDKSALVEASIDAAAQLVLFTKSPSKDGTFLVES